MWCHCNRKDCLSPTPNLIPFGGDHGRNPFQAVPSGASSPVRDIQYAAPTSVSDAVVLLSQFGSRARVLAGGTDLIVQMREHLREVDLVVDGKKIPELTALTFDSSSGLTLGAAVPCYEIYNNDMVKQHYAGLF